MTASPADGLPRLRPRARLLLTLGLELISSEQVALTELVKNSFDADAHFVLVRLTGNVSEDGAIDPEDACLEVLDDGIGMDAAVIERTWLEPATPHRRRVRESSGGRRVLGEKGVGRFAAAKLGSELELVSRASRKPEVALKVDWTAFEDEDAFLDEIPIHWSAREPIEFREGATVSRLWQRVSTMYRDTDREHAHEPSADRGTILRITGLRTPWTPQMVEEVRRSLARLVSPFLQEVDVAPDFQIILDVPESFGLASGQVQPPDELQHPHYRLEANVDEAGLATGKITVRSGGSLAIEVPLVNADGEPGLRCGPFELRLNVWDRDVESLRIVAGSESTPQVVRGVLDAAAGVSVYRDGFRVLPYGERGDDWLRLDSRRVQSPTRRLSNNQIVGYVIIGRDANPELTDQTNREGIIESVAYEDLRSAVLQLLMQLEARRYDERPRRQSTKRGGILERVDLSELRDAIASAIPKDKRIAAMVTDLQQELDERTTKIGEVLSRYHRLATLGQLVDRVVHELGQPVAALRGAATLGQEALAKVRRAPLNPSSLEMIENVGRHLETVDTQSRAVGDVVRRIAPFGGRRRGRPREYRIELAIRDAVELLRDEIDAVGAQLELPDGSTQVTVDGTELQEVLVNLLTNSLYWLKRVKKEHRAIRIAIDRNSDHSLSVTVEDSGPGVPDADTEAIFEPYFTTREGGVGLGLSIAGEIVSDYYGGRLELLPPGDLGGARFRATLRRRVG